MLSSFVARPRRLRATLASFAFALLALAGPANAQTPPYQVIPFGVSTTATVQEGQTFTPVVRVVDGSGTPVQGWTVDWTVSPSGSISTPTTTSTAGPSTLGGVTSNSFTNYVAGTYTISATTFDGEIIILKDGERRVVPAGTSAPVDFTVTVENVGMAVVDPAGGKDVILVDAVRALQVYWGSASLPTVGTTINWSIVSTPSGGTGTLGTPTATDASGFSTVDFSGDTPGDYVIQAAEFGCTWCGPTVQQFTITVVAPSADLHTILSATPDPVDPGSTISYDIGVGNNGPNAAANASFSIATPAGTTFESFAPAGAWSCGSLPAGGTGTITCTQAALASGAADLHNLVVRVAGNPSPGTPITASVAISSATADADNSNDSASATVNVASVLAYTFDKVLIGSVDNDGSNSVTIGDQLNFQVTATNTGNANLTGVVVTDDEIGTPASCPTLAPGAQCALIGGHVVDAADEQAGQYVNTASFTSAEIAGPATDTVTTTVVLIPAPGLDLQNVLSGWDDNDGTGDISPGDLLTYTITATNTGNIPLTNVQMADDKFAGTQACASVPVGGTCVLTGTDLMNDTDVPQVDNTATATANELGAPYTATNTQPVVFHPFPAMTATYTMASYDDPDGNGQVTQGDTLHLLVTATNTGNTTLTNLQIEDDALSPSVEICSGVSPGGTCQLVATYVVTQGDAITGQVDRLATLLSAELPTWGTVAFSTPATATPAVVIDTVLTGTVDMDGSNSVTEGDELDYDVIATNTGSLTLTNVVVGNDIYGGTQNCASVAPNGTCVLNVIYTVSAADASAGSVTSTGSVVSNELPTAATDAEVTAVAAPPALTIVSGDGSAGYGGQSATLVVRLLDAGGAPMTGQTITWTGASNATSVVAADGTSSNTVSFNGTTGFLTVTAEHLPSAQQVQFTLQSISATLTAVSGGNQTGAPGEALAQPLVVVANDDGNPATAPIHWSVVSGDATVSPTDVTSDPGDGTASTVVTFGTGTGPVQIQAQRTDAGETAVFDVTAAARTLAKVSGDNQVALAGAAFAAPLVVQVDLGGTPEAGASITWTTTSSTIALVPIVEPTDAAGHGKAQVTCGAIGETFTVNAELTSDPAQSVTFFGTCTLTRTLVIHDGNFQSGPPGATLPLNLVVEAQDNGVGADGVVINFTVIGGSDAQVGTCCGTTAGGGFAGTSLTLRTTPGPVQVRAERADDPTVFVVFDATAQLRGLNAVSGDNQSAPTGTALTDLLTVQTTLDGGPESNITIDWTTTATAATLTPVDNPTDANGLGTAQVTCGATAESFLVTAARMDDPTRQVTFTANCTLARTLAISSGNNQSGGPGDALPLDLVVEAQDNGVGVDGVTINFSVLDGSGSQVGSNAVATSGGGFAGTSLTLGSNPAQVQVQVRAERADDPSVFVVFDAVAQAAGLITASGDGQSAPTGSPLPNLLVAQSLLGGAPEAGVTLAWTLFGTDASLAVVTNPTDGSGLGSAQVTCGATSETVFIGVTRSDAPWLVPTFTANCTLSRALVITAGNNQSGAIGTALPQPLQVQALDNGAGKDGVTINWTVTGDATLTPAVVTSGGGSASNTLTFGGTPGAVQVRAERADDPTAFVVFDLTALQPQLAIVSGDAQTGLPGARGADLIVEYRDGSAANNPVVGATIHFGNVSGDAVLDGGSAVTDANGQARMGFTFGAAGDTVFKVHDGNYAALDFTVHATAATMLAVSGDGAQGYVGRRLDLVAQAQNDGTGAAGVPVAWTIASGSAHFLVPPAGATDAGGNAAASIVVEGAGPITVTSQRTDVPSAIATFTVQGLALPTLTAVSGDGQSGLAATTADAPLVVELRDANGLPLANEAITWTITGPGSLASPGAVTDGSGQAQATLVFGPGAGSIVVTAWATAFGPVNASFTATSLDAAIGIGSGDNQVGPVGTTLPLPLTVVVGAPSNAPGKGRVRAQALDGVPVTFTVATGGGSVAPTVVLTDATGHASAQFTLGMVEGPQAVTATVPGGATVTFNATATINRTLVVVSGNGQSGAPGAALAVPLVVHAQDNGADVAGVGITWTVQAGSATVTPSGATDAAGLANATVTLGANGAVTIRAARADDATVYVDFAASTAQIQDIVGLTPEERDLAEVIDQTCATLAGMATLTPEQQDFLARCQELTGGSIIDPSTVIDALDQLLPGMALAMQEAAFNAAQAQFQNLKARIAALRSGTQGSSFQGLALQNSSGSISLGSLGAALAQDGDDAPKGEVGAGFQRWGFFASGTIGRGEAEAGSTRPRYDYDINGLTVGLDYRYSDRFIFGGALGYTRQDSELRDAPGDLDMSGFSVSGYATWYHDDSWYMDGVLTWGRNSFDLMRSITWTVPLPGGGTSTIDQRARSQSDGDMLEGAFTFGRDFQAGGWSIGPYGRLLYTKLDFDEIHDEMDAGAGSGLGLSIDARSLTSVASEVGAKFTYAHSADWGVLTPHLQLEWEHEFKDDPKALTARFLADPNGTPFSLSGEEIDTDYFRVSLGLSLILTRGRSGFVIYERTVGREGFDQENLGFGVRIEF
jgi:uncharacterized repeat protein (TIGR01451 family)